MCKLGLGPIFQYVTLPSHIHLNMPQPLALTLKTSQQLCTMTITAWQLPNHPKQLSNPLVEYIQLYMTLKLQITLKIVKHLNCIRFR